MRIDSETNINLAEICFFQSTANYTFVHTKDRKYLSSRTLKVLATRIDADFFLKIKRGIIINKNYIKKFNNDADEPFILMVHGQKLPISRRFFPIVVKNLNHY